MVRIILQIGWLWLLCSRIVDSPTTEVTDMTPTHSMTTTQGSNQLGLRNLNESPYGDSPQHLTFDEMRELPMRLALGFDTED